METLNLHPIFVHFPVALLTLYALVLLVYIPRPSIVRLKSIVRPFLAITGALGSIASYLSGEAIEDLFKPFAGELLALHANFALGVVVFFCLMALLELFVFLGSEWVMEAIRQRFSTKTMSLFKAWLEGPVSIFFGLVGFVLIMTTGALGGAIAYGRDFDPFTKWLTGLLLKS